MTKIKNTKKGMAKKTLSMSLVVAMLATSNVPVWAAEFSDGSDASVATEADAFTADQTEAPAVEDAIEDTSAASIVTDGDITTDLKVKVGADEKSSGVWGTTFSVEGTITSTQTLSTSDINYRWVDEDGVVLKDSTGKNFLSGQVQFDTDNATVKGLSLASYAGLAGKKVSLCIYSDTTDQKFDIKTGITVSVEKKALGSVEVTFGSGSDDFKSPVYNGFAKSVDLNGKGVTVAVKDADKTTVNEKDATTGKPNYTLTSSGTAVNAKDKVTVTATATADSPYTGSVTYDIPVAAKELNAATDIVANVTKGLKYTYTGKELEIAKDKITVTESKSENNGKDGKLNGADLSSAFKSATAVNKSGNAVVDAGEYPVTVTLDGTKLTNFTGKSSAALGDVTATTDNTVEITKRDLSAKGTTISVNTTSGYVPSGVTAETLSKYLTFTGTEGVALSLKPTDYSVSIKNKATIFDSKAPIKDGGVYTVTVTAAEGGNCENEQFFDITVSSNALTSVSFANEKTYKPSYTGEAVEPTKKDLGTLSVYVDGDTTAKTIKTDSYEITGYKNNINASEKSLVSGTLTVTKPAYVNVKILDGTYKGQTASIPFEIAPLEVKDTYITVPKDISFNKSYTKPSDYKVGLKVVAKDATTGKKVEKTLTSDDYTVVYDWKTPADENVIGNSITSVITITNKNYIYGTADGKTYTVQKGSSNFVGETKIVAKKLTDSMVVVNPSSYVYTGGKIVPTYSVVDGAIALYKEGKTPDSDKDEYREVSITDAVNVGTGKIKVEGINGFYSGEATGTFTITPANTSSVKVEIADQDYTGTQIRPRKFTATLNGNPVNDQFEIVSYGENKEAGTGTVVLKPIDGNKNFTGSNITATFNIIKEKVTGVLNVYNSKGFEDSTHIFDYDGTAHTYAKEVLKITTPDTTAKASDFEIKYVDNIAGKKSSKTDANNNPLNIGWVYAVAKEGTGFAGDDTITTADGTVIKGVVAKTEVQIRSVAFVAKNVSLKNGTYAAGLPVKPQVTIQIGGTTLTEGKDYKLTLLNSKKDEVTPTDVTVDKVYGVKIEGINGYEGCTVTTDTSAKDGSEKLVWGIDKKDIKDCTVTVKDGVVTVLNGYIPVAATEYTSKNNGDGTYTVTANSTSKNYTGSKTVKADGKAEDEKPNAPMISSVKVVGNQATAILSGDSEGAAGYDYVISTDRDCIKNKDYTSVNKNQVSTSTTFKYVQQGTYYAYCHAWKRDENGKKVFSDWSNAYPFVVSAITPDAPVITNVKVSGSTIKVTYKAAANATGYDVVLGTGSKKENGETRPYNYGAHKKLNLKEGTVTATFKNVPKGTWVVGMHAFNRTSEDGKKVFSPWSNLKKATVR